MENAEIKFKSELVAARFEEIHPLLKNIARVMSVWCAERGLPFLVTEAKTTVEEDRGLNRVSKTHREGRAIDLSVRDWSSEQINEFASYFDRAYKDVAAITKSRVPRLVIYHNSGHGEHLHIQIRRIV